MCGHNAPWNLNRLLVKAKHVHGDKFDYSNMAKDHIINVESRVPVICRLYLYKWNPDIHSNI